MPMSDSSLGERLIADAIRERNEDLIGGRVAVRGLSGILAPRIDELAAERDRHLGNFLGGTRTINALFAQRDEARRERDGLAERLAAAEGEVETLRGHLAGLLATYQSGRDALRAERDSLAARLEAESERLRKAQARIGALEAERDRLRAAPAQFAGAPGENASKIDGEGAGAGGRHRVGGGKQQPRLDAS